MRRRAGLFGKYDAPTREQADHIASMLAALPKCHWCKKRVAGGQVDGLDRPVHHRCSLACWSHKRFRDRAHPNPRLPQLRYGPPTTGNGPVEKRNT